MCEICSILKNDKPFRFHRSDKLTSPVLAGEKANKYLKEFENNIFPAAAKGGPYFTAVIGEPGSGKTHFLYHLRYESSWRTDICYVIYELKDKEVNIDLLEEYIQKTIVSESMEKKNARLCLLVDTVDEYLRNISRKHNSTKEEAIEEFLSVFSQLVKARPGSCIIFAITKDVHKDFLNVLENSSFRDKFVFVKDGSQDLILETMNENETYEMVNGFLKNWKVRNNIKQKKIKECSINGFDLFPFTPGAVKLFWEAGVVPGDTSLGCTLAINDKLKNSSVDGQQDHLIITESDAARTIIHFSSYFRGYGAKEDLKGVVRELVEDRRILEDIEKIGNKASQQYYDYSDYLIEAFEFSIKLLNSNFTTKNGDIRKFVKDKYFVENDFKSIDLVFTYSSDKIGIQLLSCRRNNPPRTILNSVVALYEALRNNEISCGIVFLVYDNPEELRITQEAIKRRIKSTNPTKKQSDFLPDGSCVDYTELLNVECLHMDIAWQLVGLFDMFKGLKDKSEIKTYLKQIDSQIRLNNKLKTALSKSPQKKRLFVEPVSPHLIEK